MVGRARELTLLRQAFERASDERACHLFTILGPAGVGKSRLVAELVGELETDARVVTRTLPPLRRGDHVLAALRSAGRARRGASDRDVRSLLQSGASTPEELFFATRRLFEAVAREQPLVVVFDDVHWAEPTFLDLIDHVSDLSARGADPARLPCPARAPGRASGLGRRQAERDVGAARAARRPGERAPAGQPPRRNRARGRGTRRILEAAEGNPLFVEEMLEMLIDDGLLERRNGSWVATADLDRTWPSLARHPRPPRRPARPPFQRGARGDGAGGGRGKALSPRGGRRACAGAGARPRSPAHLVSLVRKELVRPDQPDFADEDAFRFRHLLIRDTAYAVAARRPSAPSCTERFADWLERKAGGRPGPVRGDPRLPPRAGQPVSNRARRRRCGPRAPSCRTARFGREAC